MANRESNTANFFSTTLTAEMNATALTATVATTVGGPTSPCYLVIEPGSASQREVVYFDDTFTGTTFVTTAIGNRYLSGSAAGSGLVHPVGSVVWATPLKQHIEDINDRVDALPSLATHEADTTSIHGIADTATLYRSGGTDVAVADGGTGSSTAANARTALGLAISTDVMPWVAPGTSGNLLTSNGSAWTSAASASALVRSLDTDVATVTVSNTTTETTLATYTVAQSSVAAGDIIRMGVFGDLLENAAGTMTLRVKFGATTVLTTTAFDLYPVNDADRAGFAISIDLAVESTTAQRVGATLLLVDRPTSDTWDVTGTGSGAVINGGVGYGTATENTGTGDRALTLTAQWSAASANLSIDRRAMYVTKVPAA